MKFTLAWLKRHLKTEASIAEITHALTNLGLEVEEVIDNAKAYQSFIVAEIEEAVKHPDSEKLKVCKVHNGNETLQIVCGAPNARVGIKVVLAPIGTKIPLNGMEIKASKIRGIESNGMLCSAEELGLSGDGEGIIELGSDARVGQKFAEVAGLNETIFHIGLTPNRGDAASVYGIARDLSATSIGELITPKSSYSFESKAESKIKVTIEDRTGCYEFLGRYIRDVKNSVLAENIAKTLQLIGSSPKTALVDISNYTMMEFGRPNHIYDADKIEGDIVVRKAKSEEKFIALGGEELQLDEDMLVIADNKKILAVAGIIGGELSKVDENTKNIFIEVANFNPLNIARTGRKLNINTDARYRFERRVDAGISEFFINHLTEAVMTNCGGEASNLVSICGEQPKYISEIKFSPAIISKVAGFEIEQTKINEILQKLGFIIEENKVKIPTHRRGDITSEIDLVEEILRVYGFENIPSAEILIKASELFSKSLEKEKRISERLRLKGLDEVISWSFTDEQTAKNFGFDNLIMLENPISSELSVMRPTIIPNLLGFIAKNLVRGFNNFGLFERGEIFGKEFRDSQSACISGVRVGNMSDKTVHKEERKADFYDIKSDVFAICSEALLNPENLSVTKNVPQYYHPYRSGAFKLGNKLIAFAGEIHPNILKTLNIKENVVGFEVFLENIPKVNPKNAKSKLELSDFQAVNRDFAFIVDEALEAQSILKVIKSVNKSLIENVSIFDIYSGKGVEEGKKSIALSIKIQPKDKTLFDKEIEEICTNIINEVSIKCGAKLR
ncbi:phenylalanyl-tRNA ligase subunit beta [endosymbiont of Acanthamoeba sp. UWC8]|uniref:phenylalanine--tRNA ligase subunit beta n=1 Tax=endosymbiont of Acanthamoeba sp. UWC8 TaxID=86106 RepID=UPI0004D1C8BB|nr:phenylalanine--tRNA ligase subunit beta [endosymbiont of Acanthamoeba sp. UWC8]AIF81935.1 phenylalanyl-tRNA ligase subunit beta [endosymbiont of Acanthamoeba sp. UWC8]